MRNKPWARPELAACEYNVSEPLSKRGKWREAFKKEQPLHIELGCGKGFATCRMVHENKNVNYVAVDLISNVLAVTRRNIAAEYGKEPIENVLLAAFDITLIRNYFAPEDRVERIYISFCNPWDKKQRHERKRLTHPRQLVQYREFLTENGEIWFKTDNDILFEDSLKYFAECGFETVYLTRDLHSSGFSPNYVSEHERMFSEKEVPIKAIIVKKKSGV